MINIWKSDYSKYLSAQFDIENTNIILNISENFFNPTNFYSYITILHNHDKHELLFIKEGSCVICINEKNYHLRADSFIIIPAKADHNIFDISNDFKFFPMLVQFYKNDNCGDIFDMLTALTNPNNIPNIYYNCGDLLKKLDNLLQTVQESHQIAYRERCEISIISIFIDIILQMNDYYKKLKITVEKTLKENPVTINNKKNKQIYIDIIDGYFNSFYRNEMSLNELAEQLNLSSRHTRRLLKNIHGMTFEEIAAHTRIKMAKQLLSETNLPLKDICSQVGYSAYSVFFRAFRDITGQSPTDYRKTI